MDIAFLSTVIALVFIHTGQVHGLPVPTVHGVDASAAAVKQDIHSSAVSAASKAKSNKDNDEHMMAAVLFACTSMMLVSVGLLCFASERIVSGIERCIRAWRVPTQPVPVVAVEAQTQEQTVADAAVANPSLATRLMSWKDKAMAKRFTLGSIVTAKRYLKPVAVKQVNVEDTVARQGDEEHGFCFPDPMTVASDLDNVWEQLAPLLEERHVGSMPNQGESPPPPHIEPLRICKANNQTRGQSSQRRCHGDVPHVIPSRVGSLQVPEAGDSPASTNTTLSSPHWLSVSPSMRSVTDERSVYADTFEETEEAHSSPSATSSSSDSTTPSVSAFPDVPSLGIDEQEMLRYVTSQREVDMTRLGEVGTLRSQKHRVLSGRFDHFGLTPLFTDGGEYPLPSITEESSQAGRTTTGTTSSRTMTARASRSSSTLNEAARETHDEDDTPENCLAYLNHVGYVEGAEDEDDEPRRRDGSLRSRRPVSISTVSSVDSLGEVGHSRTVYTSPDFNLHGETTSAGPSSCAAGLVSSAGDQSPMRGGSSPETRSAPSKTPTSSPSGVLLGLLNRRANGQGYDEEGSTDSLTRYERPSNRPRGTRPPPLPTKDSPPAVPRKDLRAGSGWNGMVFGVNGSGSGPRRLSKSEHDDALNRAAQRRHWARHRSFPEERR